MKQQIVKTIGIMAIAIAVMGNANGGEELSAVHVDSARSLVSAVAEAQPGAVIVLTDGTYDQAIKLAGKGAAGSPVVVRAQSIGGVKMKQPLSITGNHLAVIGFTFTHRGSVKIQGRGHRLSRCHMDNVRSGKWVQASSGCRELEIDHCLFENKENNRQLLRGCQLIQLRVLNREERHRIHHNHFRNIPKGKTSNGYETIQIITKRNPFDPDTVPNAADCETVIAHNLFEQCNGEAEIISNKANGNRIHGNTFIASRGSVVLRHGHRNTVEGNIFIGGDEKGSGGIRIQGRDQVVADNFCYGLGRSAVVMMDGTPDNLYVRVERAQILRNIIVECELGLLIGKNHSKHPNGTVPKDCRIADNRIVNPRTVAVQYVQGDEPEGWTWEGNVVKGTIGIPGAEGIMAGNPRLTKPEGLLTENDVGPMAGLERKQTL